MSTLTIKVVDRLIDIDLGESATSKLDNHGYFNGETWGGNAYLYIDGVEFGSLFVHLRDGQPIISLGQYDDNTQDWETRNDLRPINESAQIPMEDNR